MDMQQHTEMLPALAAKLGPVRERFLRAWQGTGRPRLEDFIANFAGPELSLLVRELLVLEVEQRAQRGEQAEAEEYRRRLPDHAAVIDGVFDTGKTVSAAPAPAAAHAQETVSLPPPDTTPTNHEAATVSLPPPLPAPDGDETTAARRDDAATADLPARAGRYKIESEIARGGMGAIWRARDPDLGRTLAIKVLLAPHRERSDLEHRFREEAQITGQLQHPGIPPVHEVGTLADGRPFFAMKLIEGRTLADLLKERSAPAHDLPRFLGIFEQVCQTLAYAHTRGVIHRDLKPLNIMVGAFGEVQVMDWGLAKVLGKEEHGAGAGADLPLGLDGTGLASSGRISTVRASDPELMSQAGVVLGTPAFMPPEQARGEIDKLDERCDVFGLGAILCVILTGQPPFHARGWQVILERAIRGDLEDAWTRLQSSGADVELIDLARACLAPDKESRPRHAGAVAERVAAYQAAVQERLRRAELERAEAQVKAAEERKRRRLQVSLAAAVLVAIIVLTAGAIWYQSHRAEAARKLAVTEEAVTQSLKQGGLTHAKLKESLMKPGGVQAMLNEPAQWEMPIKSARGDWARAQAVARNADEALDPLLAENLQELDKDLSRDEDDFALALRLEKIRSDKITVAQGTFAYGRAAAEYQKAFHDAGLDIEPGRESEVATLMNGSAIKDQLLTALDDWAWISFRNKDQDKCAELLRVGRLADPDLWRDKVRDPTLWKDVPKLMALTRDVGVDRTLQLRLSPRLMHLIFILLPREKQEAKWLRLARALDEADFWINFHLAAVLVNTMGDNSLEAAGFYRVALAIRPHSPIVYNNLGNILLHHDAGDAAAAYKKAIALEPKMGMAWENLGRALRARKDFPGAVVALKNALALNPQSAAAWEQLALALAEQHDLVGAADAFMKAAAAEPNRPNVLNGWHRYNAACAAVLAAAGDARLANNDKIRLRRQAQDRLQAELAAHAHLLEEDRLAAPKVVQRMRHWLADPDLASVRDKQKLARFPDDECLPWIKLWAEIADLRQRARASYTETMHEGQLTAKERAKTYPVAMAAGKTYVIDMASNQFNTYLRVEDDQGKAVAENDDAGSRDRNSHIRFTSPRDATYRIVATSAHQLGAGGYLLRICTFAKLEPASLRSRQAAWLSSRLRAYHVLVEINDRPRHQTGPLRQEKGSEFRHLRRLDEPPERLFFLRLLQPLLTGTMESLLDGVFGGTIHPAQVEAVDADAVLEHSAGHVAGQGRQGALGGGIGRQERLATVAGHADDVKNRAGTAAVDHSLNGSLHEEERRTHIDGHDAVKNFRRRVQDRAAFGGGGAVDQDVDAVKHTPGRVGHAAAIFNHGQLGPDEFRPAAPSAQLAGQPFAVGGIAAAYHQPLDQTSVHQPPGDGLAKALRAAGDDCDFVGTVGHRLGFLYVLPLAASRS